MIISHKHKFIFFSAPKTGSESIRRALERYNEELILPWRHTTRRNPFYHHMPPYLALKEIAFRGKDVSKYDKITCLRNPLDRLYSLYKMVLRVDRRFRHPFARLAETPNFEKWLLDSLRNIDHRAECDHRKWLQYGLWSAQQWCIDDEENVLIDHLIPTEHISDQIPRLLRRLGVHDPIEIPHINQSQRNTELPKISPEVMSLTESRYAWDQRYIEKYRKGSSRINEM